MKKDIVKIIGIFIVAILQLSVFSKISIFESLPNLVVILSIALVFRGLFRDGLLVAIIGGILIDIVSPLHFGIYTILTVTTIVIIHFVILKNVPAPNQLLILLFYFIIFLGINLIISLFIAVMPSWQVIIDAGVNSIWGILIYLLLGKIIKPKEEIKFV